MGFGEDFFLAFEDLSVRSMAASAHCWPRDIPP
nr:MAG TPA: hypothetical protein [Caudoviricetes sp.]DAK80498.1 MAG TPA: hypothetical protein [Caudoviricetes sp.]